MSSYISPETGAAFAEAQRQQQEAYQRQQALKAPPPRAGMESDEGGVYIADREQTPAAIGQRLEGFAHAVGDTQAAAEAFKSAVDGGGFGDSPDGQAVAALLKKVGDDLKTTAAGLGESTGVLWRTTLDGLRSVGGQDEENVAGLTSKMGGWEP